MEIAAWTALWWLPFILPIGIWVAWNDMAFMKIPNKSVIAALIVFVVVGLVALPFTEYLWRYAHFGVVLAVGFVLNVVRAIGAGDAKFAAAMAPFIDRGDLVIFLYLMTAVVIAAMIVHRVAKRIPAMRRAFPDWESWERKDFPMGLALGPGLILYLAIGAYWGA